MNNATVRKKKEKGVRITSRHFNDRFFFVFFQLSSLSILISPYTVELLMKAIPLILFLLHSSSLHVNAFFPSQKRGLFITTHNNAILQMVSSSPAPSPPKPAPTFIFSPQDDNSMASIIQTMTSIQQGEQRKLGK